MRVLPGDVFRLGARQVTLVGFLGSSDLVVWDGSKYFTIGSAVASDDNCMQIDANAESRIASTP
jgi:hypothetical protein